MLKRWLLADILILAIVLSFAAQICTSNIVRQQNVVYGQSGPITDAYVSASGDNGSGEAFTGSSGSYSISKGLATGTYNVTAGAEGYIDGEQDFVNVTAGSTTSGINFDLLLSGGISGTITDAVNGSLLNGTFLYATSATGTNYEWFGESDANGHYLINTDLGTDMYNVSVELPPTGYITASTIANVTAGVETKNVDFALARSGIISGQVTDPNGNGLYNVTVYASSEGSSTTYFGYTTTDMNGNYRISTDLGTASYDMTAYGDGNFSELLSPVNVTAGQETSGVNIELTPVTPVSQPSGFIIGQVTDQSTGSPVPFASISAYSASTGDSGYATADEHGNYNISSGLGTANDYNVSASATGYNDTYYPSLVSVTVDQTTSGINIQMIPSSTAPTEYGTITGTITGPPVTIPEFQYPLLIMLSSTLIALIASRLVLKSKRYKNKDNAL